MTALDRAEQYIGIFINAGDRWEFYVPVDGVRTPTGIWIDGIEVGPDTEEPGVWWLDDGVNPVRRYRAVSWAVTPVTDVPTQPDPLAGLDLDEAMQMVRDHISNSLDEHDVREALAEQGDEPSDAHVQQVLRAVLKELAS